MNARTCNGKEVESEETSCNPPHLNPTPSGHESLGEISRPPQEERKQKVPSPLEGEGWDEGGKHPLLGKLICLQKSFVLRLVVLLPPGPVVRSLRSVRGAAAREPVFGVGVVWVTGLSDSTGGFLHCLWRIFSRSKKSSRPLWDTPICEGLRPR